MPIPEGCIGAMVPGGKNALMDSWVSIWLTNITWPLRAVLAGCVVGTIVPRVEIQAGAALLGVLLLVGVWRLSLGRAQRAPAR